MNNIAERIKDSVPMIEAARFYGLEVNQHGDALCPFHREKTASLHIYSGNRGWHCFGCGAGGDVIDFVQLSFGLSFQDALAKINDDFQLGLQVQRRSTLMSKIIAAQEAYKAKQKRMQRDEELRNAWWHYMLLTDLFRIYKTIIHREKLKMRASMDDEALAIFDFSDAYAIAVKMLPEVEYMLEQAESKLKELKRNTTHE